MTDNFYKERYTLHLWSLRDKNKRHATSLSNVIWTLNVGISSQQINGTSLLKPQNTEDGVPNENPTYIDKLNIMQSVDKILKFRDKIVSPLIHKQYLTLRHIKKEPLPMLLNQP